MIDNEMDMLSLMSKVLSDDGDIVGNVVNNEDTKPITIRDVISDSNQTNVIKLKPIKPVEDTKLNELYDDVQTKYEFDVDLFFKLLADIDTKATLTGHVEKIFDRVCFNSLMQNNKNANSILLTDNDNLDRVFSYQSKEKGKTYFSVTELLDCEMKNYLKRLGYDKDEDYKPKYPYARLMADTGSFLHAYIEHIYPFDETEYKCFDNKKLISFVVDGIINKTVIEIKTVSDPNYKDEKHYKQASLYAYLLNQEDVKYHKDIERVEIVKLSRDLKTFVVDAYNYDEHMIQTAKKILSQSYKIRKAVKDKNPTILDKSKDKCVFCPYKQACASI